MNSLPINMSSSISTPKKYDVYLSFRSEDVRKKFASHLHAALSRKNIKTYIEDLDILGVGAIEESKLSVVIFSENYASSPRCLDELVHILRKGKFVLPVFYDVDPSNLSKQIGSNKTAIDQVDEWRRALEAASSLSGRSSSDFRTESELVDEIVEDVLKQLIRTPPFHYSEFLVGIDERIEKIESLLRIGSPDACRIVGIFGQDGIGKTTLAHLVYDKLSSQFESSCFLWNVKDESNRHGLTKLQNKLFAELLGKTNQDMSNLSLGPNFSPRKFRPKKVLIVLDDVNNSNQVRLLASKQELFGHGSRIVVTTRDVQVLKSIGTKSMDVYQIEELNYQEALQLFHSTCFRNIFPTKEYRELSKQIVDYANGNPLALKLLGSLFCDKGIEMWEDMMTKLKKAPKFKVAKMLKRCYDELDSNQKNIFLDIACFFRGMKRDYVEQMLDYYPTSISDAIDDLIAKSLITLGHSNELQMHDLVQEMGWDIAFQESKRGSHSRLWSAKDAYEVLKHNRGTAAIKGLSLDMSEIEEELHLEPDLFNKMTNLRLLKLYSSSTSNRMPSSVSIHQDFHHLPNTLKCLHWEHYPLTTLPQKFSLENLVELNMAHSQLEKLWDGVQPLKNLKAIDLSYCSKLIELPDLSKASELEHINIQGCMSLSSVPSHFQYLDQLITLNLNGCSSLNKFPVLPLSITILNLSGTSIENLPSSIERLVSLKTLEFRNCKKLKSLPTNICKLKTLDRLIMSGCSELKYFPEILEAMEHLLYLCLNNTGIKELPPSIENINGLVELDMERCENLECLPSNIYNLSKLETLIVSDCVKLKALPAPGQSVHFPSLSQFKLNNCSITEVPDDQLAIFSSLESLDLSGNENIVVVPTSIKKLSKLKYLDISNCSNLRSLPEIPLSLELVDAHGCVSLKRVSSSKTALTRGWDHLDANSEKLVFFNCLKLDQNALNNLISDSQIRILRMATVSRNKSKHVLEYPSVSICYPGEQIPQWFSYQAVGSSINIKLPPQWRNANFLGFSLCVVAAPHNFHPQIDFICESHLRSKDGCRHTLRSLLRGYSQYNGDEGKARTFYKRNHVFLWYDYGLFHHGLEDVFFNCTEVLFVFYPTDSLEGEANSWTVEKCGIHMLYLQEAAEFDLNENLILESRAEASSALFGNNNPSERGTSHPNNGIEELGEEDVIQSGSEPSPDGDVCSDIEEGNDNQHLKGIDVKELDSCCCLHFLSPIKEFLEYVHGKKYRHDKGFGYELQPELSTFRGTPSLSVKDVEQYLQELENAIKHMHSQIVELQSQNNHDLESLKWMTQRPLPGRPELPSSST